MVQRNSKARAQMLAERRAGQRSRVPGLSVPYIGRDKKLAFYEYPQQPRPATRNDHPSYRKQVKARRFEQVTA